MKANELKRRFIKEQPDFGRICKTLEREKFVPCVFIQKPLGDYIAGRSTEDGSVLAMVKYFGKPQLELYTYSSVKELVDEVSLVQVIGTEEAHTIDTLRLSPQQVQDWYQNRLN